MSAKVMPLRQRGNERNATSGRLANSAYRIREHLTEAEMEKLLAALKRNRHGRRDWLIGLLIYRHGLRVSEACDLRWMISICRSAPSPSAGLRGVPIVSIIWSGTNTGR